MTDATPSAELSEVEADPRYIDDSVYQEVVDLMAAVPVAPPADAALSARAAAVLHREARLLDDRAYAEWLKLFTFDCVYWAPITPGGGDPRREVSLTFDDRRRLEDRVARFDTGWMHAQIPPSATVRQVGNVEAWPHGGDILVTSTNVIWDHRKHHTEVYPARAVHVLRPEGHHLAIHRRIVSLVNADTAMANVAFVI